MAAKALPPQSELLQLLRYEPDTGKLVWRERTADMFSGKTPRRSASLCDLWNARYAEQEAFTSVADGYRIGSVNGSNFKAHRIIWRMAHGVEPDEIDHINGLRTDNRLSNLRDVSLQVNARNKRRLANRASEVTRVHLWDHDGKNQYWVASISSRCLGYFHSFDDAVAARRAAEVTYGFHPNHGRN